MTPTTNIVSNEVTDTTRFYYDDNGNTIAEQNKIYSSGTENSKMLLSGRSGGGTMKVYEYDKFNRLVKYNDGGTEATYTYNANNLRQSKTVNGRKTSFVWNGQN